MPTRPPTAKCHQAKVYRFRPSFPTYGQSFTDGSSPHLRRSLTAYPWPASSEILIATGYCVLSTILYLSLLPHSRLEVEDMKIRLCANSMDPIKKMGQDSV